MRNTNRQAQKRPRRAESPPSYIPTDLLRLILLRLPVKSLCRFKCVSASWNSIISDPHFEALQFDSSATSLLISVYHNGSLFFSTGFGQTRNDGPVERQQPLPFLLRPPRLRPKLEIREPFSQSLGGLILVRFDHTTMRIYNPSTGESSCVIRVPEHMDSYKAASSVFGYDPICRTHKILGMWIGVGTKYCVLTLHNQMKWRSLRGGDSHMPIAMATMRSICLNGVVYSLGFRTSDNLDLWFGGFDVRSEVLRWVRLPLSFMSSLSLIGFNGRATIYDQSKLNNDSNGEVVLWMFEGFDAQLHPWRQIRIAKPPQWKQVINRQAVTIEGTVPSGELLLRNFERRSVLPITSFYFNMESKIITSVSVLSRPAETELLFTWSRSKPEEYNFVSVTGHVESIKSLKYPSN